MLALPYDHFLVSLLFLDVIGTVAGTVISFFKCFYLLVFLLFCNVIYLLKLVLYFFWRKLEI